MLNQKVGGERKKKRGKGKKMRPETEKSEKITNKNYQKLPGHMGAFPFFLRSTGLEEEQRANAARAVCQSSSSSPSRSRSRAPRWIKTCQNPKSYPVRSFLLRPTTKADDFQEPRSKPEVRCSQQRDLDDLAQVVCQANGTRGRATKDFGPCHVLVLMA